MRHVFQLIFQITVPISKLLCFFFTTIGRFWKMISDLHNNLKFRKLNEPETILCKIWSIMGREFFTSYLQSNNLPREASGVFNWLIKSSYFVCNSHNSLSFQFNRSSADFLLASAWSRSVWILFVVICNYSSYKTLSRMGFSFYPFSFTYEFTRSEKLWSPNWSNLQV